MTLRGGSFSRGSWPLAGLITLSLLGAGPGPVALAPSAAVPPGGFSNRSDHELLLFEVRLQGATLSDSRGGIEQPRPDELVGKYGVDDGQRQEIDDDLQRGN